MHLPLVSVVIPFYENKKWLVEAIDSVIKQTYKNLEILVINDGSTENIDEVKKKYGEKIKIFNKENGGPSSARNFGIEKSNGKYIAFLDSDDVWFPNKLKKQVEKMELNGYIWSQHSYEMFWDNSDKTKVINTSIYAGDVYKDCFISFKVQTSCVVVLRSVLIEKNIKFPLHKRYGQDGSFYKQLAKHYPLGYVDDVLSRFRIRGTNAGFKAIVQISNRALIWKEIKDDNRVLNLLPKGIIFAYKTSYSFYKLIRFTNKIIRKEASIEWLAKFMYITPYLIFKLYSKKSM